MSDLPPPPFTPATLAERWGCDEGAIRRVWGLDAAVRKVVG